MIEKKEFLKQRKIIFFVMLFTIFAATIISIYRPENRAVQKPLLLKIPSIKPENRKNSEDRKNDFKTKFDGELIIIER